MAIWQWLLTSAQAGANALLKPVMFPWFNDAQATWVLNQTKDEQDEKLKKQKEYELYKKMLPVAMANKKQDERIEAKKELMYQSTQEKDVEKKSQMDLTLKMADFADQARNYGLKNGKDLTNIPDNEVIGAIIKTVPNGAKMFEDYMNNWDDSLLVQAGIKQPEVAETNDDWISTIGKIATTAGGIWLWLAGLKFWGITLESLWKKIYWLTINPTQQEAEAIQSYKAGTSSFKPKTWVETALEQPILQKWWRTISSKIWQMWTRAMIWEQAEAAATRKFTDIINPIMNEADNVGISFDYASLFQKAKENIQNSAKYSDTQKKTILENIDELAHWYEWTTTLKNLDLEKQAIAGKIPQKYQTMAKLPNELKAAQKEVASVFRNTVHTTIKESFWVDSAKIYQDYANLKWLSKIWPKALTEAGRKWGAGSFLSWASEEIATPVTTVVGKLSYKAGKVMEMLPDLAVKWIKLLPKVLEKMKWSMSGVEFVDLNMINEWVHQSKIWILQWAIKNWWKTWIYKEIYKELWWQSWVQKEIDKLKNNPPAQVKTALIDYLWE